MIFFVMVLIPVVIIAVFISVFGRKKYTWHEALSTFGIGVVIALLFACIESCNSKQGDHQYVNGKVIDKKQKRVSCSHSYDCHCRTECSGRGRDRSCSKVCDTCYEHWNDYDWMVYFNSGHHIRIKRVDRQGVDTPSRWASVNFGDPGTFIEPYTNYIKGAPESLFYYRDTDAIKQFKGKLPKYHLQVFDYYKATKVFDYDGVLGAGVLDIWNATVAKLNAELGPTKQANLTIVIVKDRDPAFYRALKTVWVGGKKNDIIPVISVDAKLNIQWVEVMGWSRSSMFNVSLKDALQQLKVLDDRVFPVIMTEIDRNYVRKSMKDFEYLTNMATPSPGLFLTAVLIQVFFCVGFSIYCVLNDFTYDSIW